MSNGIYKMENDSNFKNRRRWRYLTIKIRQFQIERIAFG